MEKSAVSSSSSTRPRDESQKPRHQRKSGKRFRHVFHASVRKGQKPGVKETVRLEAPIGVGESRSKRAAKDGGTEAGVGENFSPPPSVLAQPIAGPSAAETTAVGSGAERAQAAALAERLVTSIRVADLGKDRYAVHVRVAGLSHRGGIDVELRHEHGELKAVLKPEADAIEDAKRLGEAFKLEAADRGLNVEAIEIEY